MRVGSRSVGAVGVAHARGPRWRPAAHVDDARRTRSQKYALHAPLLVASLRDLMNARAPTPTAAQTVFQPDWNGWGELRGCSVESICGASAATLMLAASDRASCCQRR